MKRNIRKLNICVVIFFIFCAMMSFSVEKVIIEYFGREDCKNCVQLEQFLDQLLQERNDLEIIAYKIDQNESHKNKFDETVKKFNLAKVTPIIYIDGQIITGYDQEKTTGETIKGLIEKANKKEKIILLDEYMELANGEIKSIEIAESCSVDNPEGSCSVIEEKTIEQNETKNKEQLLVTIPLIKKVIDIGQLSLPVMSIVLGTIDGVNPCAMWVLVLFLTALIAIGNKKKMFQVAGLFILAEGIMYYFILNVWIKTWDFVRLDNIVTPLVGVVGIIGGALFIRNFIVKGNELSCDVTDMKKRSTISKKISDIANKPLTFVVAIAIIGLALSVNVIEFACSVGIPQTFTKILQINNVSFIQRQLYLLIYIIGYMIDDIVVFGFALISVNKLQLTGKYSKWANLFGGIIMIVLGLILIVKPSLLIF